MKIVVLGTRGFPKIQGGVEVHCENLYPRLVTKGCEIIVFTRKPYVVCSEIIFKGVKLVPLSCPKQKKLEALIHTLKGLFYARRLKPDILHFHAIGPSLLIPLARLMGFKVVMTHHGPDYKRKKWGTVARVFLKFGEYLGCKLANEVIAISEPIAADILKKYEKKSTVIPNGVVIPEISTNDEALKKFGLLKGRYILSIGRFVPEKGFHDLIEAFKIVSTPLASRNDMERWKLVIVGDADHEDKYSRELKRKAGEVPNVILTGFLTGQSLQELYSHAGLFVLSSYYEGLPIVLLEAMSYGLHCLVSDIPAHKNMGLDDNVFFKVGNVAELENKIINAIDKPLPEEERQRQIGSIRENYDWEKIADKTLAVYSLVCHDN